MSLIRCSACAIFVLVMMVCVIAERPNVLILLTDDQRADSLAALGNPDVLTPHLDQLVRSGCNVSSCYCLGADRAAVCRPSRNMLLSGRTYFRWTHPRQGQPQMNAPALPNTLPATFNAAGYETYHHGKRGNTATNIHKQFDHSHYLDDFGDRWSGEAGKKVIDDAVAFLDRRGDANEPWLMYLAFATPHDPRAATDQALGMYDADLLQLPPASAPFHPFDNGSVLGRDEWTAVWPRSPQVIRDQLHDYYAVISTIDANIGRLLADLKRRGQYDNTVIVFTSDHGLSMGGHGLMGKQNVYEDGYRAPMVIAGPGVKHGAASDPVYLMDLFPTLCDLTGVAVPKGLDGRSFAAMVSGDANVTGDGNVTGNAKGPHDAIMLSYTDSQRAVRQGRWKLIRYPQINRTQLFDLHLDPFETKNLSKDPEQSHRIAELMETMKRLQRDQGDDLPLTAPDAHAGLFTPPLPVAAPKRRPVLGKGNLQSTPLAGNATAGSEPFTVRKPAGGYITAIAIGVSRTQPHVVTSLRIDVVGKGQADSQRQSVIVGEPNPRWTPLLDQMKPNRQPAVIHGAASEIVHRVGIRQGDGRQSPAYGGPGGEAFEIGLDGEDAEELAERFQGFHGTTIQRDGQRVIESLGMLFVDPE